MAPSHHHPQVWSVAAVLEGSRVEYIFASLTLLSPPGEEGASFGRNVWQLAVSRSSHALARRKSDGA